MVVVGTGGVTPTNAYWTGSQDSNWNTVTAGTFATNFATTSAGTTNTQAVPGSTTNAPEFALENTASAVLRLTQANSLVYNNISGFSVDLSATSSLGLMASSPQNLVNQLNTMFMHGQMPSNMQTEIVSHISTLTNMAERVRVAIYLIITSSQYKIEH